MKKLSLNAKFITTSLFCLALLAVPALAVQGQALYPSSSMPDEPAVSVIAPVEEPEPEPEPEPVLPYTNPLTGEGSAVDLAGARPVAIMLNNLKKALPQLGVSQADLIYELPAEGGITRMAPAAVESALTQRPARSSPSTPTGTRLR